MNILFGQNFLIMAIRFNGSILQTMNFDFMLSFFKDCCKVLATHLSTHSINVSLFSSRYLFFYHNIVSHLFNRILEWLEHVNYV
jgi:hypothetical protein